MYYISKNEIKKERLCARDDIRTHAVNVEIMQPRPTTRNADESVLLHQKQRELRNDRIAFQIPYVQLPGVSRNSDPKSAMSLLGDKRKGAHAGGGVIGVLLLSSALGSISYHSSYYVSHQGCVGGGGRSGNIVEASHWWVAGSSVTSGGDRSGSIPAGQNVCARGR